MLATESSRTSNASISGAKSIRLASATIKMNVIFQAHGDSRFIN